MVYQWTMREIRKSPGLLRGSSFTGGQSEIRTRGGLPLNGFQDRLFRPLRHLSNVHNTRNANIAQHSEIIRIATRKIIVISRQMSPDYPHTDAKWPNCEGLGIPNRPDYPHTDAKYRHCGGTGIPNQPEHPQTDANWKSDDRNTTRGKESRAQ